MNNKAKPALFMPSSKLELSVYDVVGLEEPRIWRLGETRVSEPQNKTLYGRADVFVALVHRVGLVVELGNDPPRHANICGWPEEKSARKLLALQLAQKASLKLRSL